MLSIYPWQEKQWQQLMAMQQHGRMPHALLLTGPEGIGLGEFAQALAMHLLCLANTGEACGTCQSCQLFKAGNHPDINLIEPEEQGKQIKVSQIRELIDYVGLKSFSGQIKVAIVNPADAMNRATANAFLKTLEEPPEQSMLILLTHNPTRLPVTIRSRCQRIDFEPNLSESTISWLQQKISDPESSAELLLRLSHGGPLKAIELMESDQLQQRREIIKDLQFLSRENADVVQIAANWQNFGCDNVLACLMRITQDLVRLKLLNSKAKLLNFDIKEDLQDLVKTLDLLALVRNYDFIQDKYQEVTGPMNYNPLSILEDVIIHWASPKQT